MDGAVTNDRLPRRVESSGGRSRRLRGATSTRTGPAVNPTTGNLVRLTIMIFILHASFFYRYPISRYSVTDVSAINQLKKLSSRNKASSKPAKSIQHLHFPRGPPPEYSASSTTFNFRVPMVSGALAVIWSYAESVRVSIILINQATEHNAPPCTATQRVSSPRQHIEGQCCEPASCAHHCHWKRNICRRYI